MLKFFPGDGQSAVHAVLGMARYGANVVIGAEREPEPVGRMHGQMLVVVAVRGDLAGQGEKARDATHVFRGRNRDVSCAYGGSTVSHSCLEVLNIERRADADR